jgi:hypothetical protein
MTPDKDRKEERKAAMTKQPKEGFEVLWCVDMPALPDDGGADIDNAKYETREFTDYDAAVAFAKEVAATAWYGIGQVRQFEDDRYGSRTILDIEEVDAS